MNALELADELFNYLPSHDAEKFATMLRQQQAEIEALKGEVAYLKHINRNWAISEGLVLKEIEALKAKTLTDKVLMQLYEVADYSPESYLEEARAILRKAQEK